MNLMQFLFQDLYNNKGNTKGVTILFMYRLALFSSKNIFFIRLLLKPYLIFYKFFVSWLLGIELPFLTPAGPGLKIFHGQSLVVHNDVIIGNEVTLRHNTTIGITKGENGEIFIPKIGNNVDIGANCVIIGDVNIGDNTIIGAGSVVTKSLPCNTRAAGNPAKILI